MELNVKIINHYSTLSEEEIKILIVNDKWFANLEIAILNAVECVTQSLANRVQELMERYAYSIQELNSRVNKYSQRVDTHLKQMGLNW